MLIMIDKHTRITHDAEGNVHITRWSITGRISEHVMRSDYDIFDIARWIYRRMMRLPNPLVQEAFPGMYAADREFLMTGITPDEWKEMFKGSKEGED